jgi:ABC-type multidrug transport system fused ATPase/permease subunit
MVKMTKNKKLKNKEAEENELDLLHPRGLKGLLIVYDFCHFWKYPSFFVAFFISFLTFCFLTIGGFSSEKLFNVITEIVDTGLSLDGGLIGLSLAGLTLIVTFGSEKLLKSMVKISVEDLLKNGMPDKSKIKFSSYQTAVSKFGFAVFVQVISLIILFFYNLILKLELPSLNESLNTYFNAFFLSLAVFLILYSVFLVAQMTINIFTISQMNHSLYLSESIEEILADEKKKNSPTNSNPPEKER